MGEFTGRSNSETGRLPRAPPLTPDNSSRRRRSLSWARPIGCAAAGPIVGAGRPLPEKLLAGYQPGFVPLAPRWAFFHSGRTRNSPASRVASLPSFLAFIHCTAPRILLPPCWPTQGWRAQVCSPGFAPTFTQRQPSADPAAALRHGGVMTQWWKRQPAFGEENLGLRGGGSVTAGGFKGPGLGPWPWPWWVTEVKGPRVHPKLTSAPFCLHFPLAAWAWERRRGRVWSLEQPGRS